MQTGDKAHGELSRKFDVLVIGGGKITLPADAGFYLAPLERRSAKV